MRVTIPQLSILTGATAQVLTVMQVKEMTPWFFDRETGKATVAPNEVHLKNGGGVVLSGIFRLKNRNLRRYSVTEEEQKHSTTGTSIHFCCSSLRGSVPTQEGRKNTQQPGFYCLEV